MEGGIEAAYRRDIAEAADPEGKRQELESMLREMSSPFRTAEAFGVEEIIDPRDTRSILCRFVEVAEHALLSRLRESGRGDLS